MTRPQTNPIISRVRIVIALALLALGIVAAPALAAAPAEFDRVSEELPAAPEPPQNGDIDLPIVPVPGEDPFPGEPPVVTTPPKLEAASFGIGWPAAAAAGVALLAVLGMALMWRREPSG
ncbi:MAG: hypothetical protein GY720_15300 [bacterium]|nr:hypothetical protein [bacterium]